MADSPDIAALDAEAPPATRRPWVAWAGIATVAILVAIALQVAGRPDGEEGTQQPTGSVVLRRASSEGWDALEPTTGRLRSGFPTPMVWRSDRVCIGFARIDFGPDDVRPSLARCEQAAGAEMASNEIRSLMSIESGFDTWHFIEAAAPVADVTVRLVDGELVGDDRIHLSGSTIALRLEVARDLAAFDWSTSRERFRCVPDPAAWRTSVFCPGR